MIFLLGIILGIIFITTRCCENLQQIETGTTGCFDRPHEGVDYARDRLRLARRDLALASAEVTAFIARETSWDDNPQISPVSVPSIGGRRNLTVRSRRGGSTRSMQSRIAVGSPASAISTALRVKASDSPASSAAAASVPRRRPPGLPNRLFSNGRIRTRPSGFYEILSLIIISSPLFNRRRTPWRHHRLSTK